ncbi:MAG: DUF1566 domain-containing protein [Chitinophagaceae bacterium]|nr:DUF1566 domain-containing protein [Oligoflexus sp.]
MKYFLITQLFGMFLGSACKSELTVTDSSPRLSRVDSFDRSAAKSGDIVTFSGKNLNSSMKLFIGSKAVPFTLNGDSKASFTVPSDIPSGVLNVTFTNGTNTILTMPLINSSTVAALPLMTADPATICSDVLYTNPDGVIARGLRSCQLDLCTHDGQSDCKANVDFPAVDAHNLLLAKNIRKGLVIGGVTGNFPSADAPLTTGEASDLSVSLGINANSISIGSSVLGVSGSAPVYLLCGSDGQTGCITGPRFKAVDVSLLTIWDIRRGKSAGGILGSLDYKKNMINTSVFNRTVGTDALAGADAYDTIDDYGGGVLPTTPIPGTAAFDASNFQRDPLSDTGVGGGIAGNGLCDGTEHCVYVDHFTGLYFSPIFAASPWEAAITTCSALIFGGYTDWRLPTQKELFQASIDSFSSISLALGDNPIAGLYSWTGTTISGAQGYAYSVAPFAMFTVYHDKVSVSHQFHCVR